MGIFESTEIKDADFLSKSLSVIAVFAISEIPYVLKIICQSSIKP